MTHFYFSRPVVLPVLVLQLCLVSVPEETLDAIVALQFADHLVDGLALHGFLMYGERRPTNGRQEGGVSVLNKQGINLSQGLKMKTWLT